MKATELIGLFAGALTTVAFIPQVIKIIKTKSADGVSLQMYIVFTIGIVLWLIYGLLINDTPMIAANTITLLLASVVLFYKIKLG